MQTTSLKKNPVAANTSSSVIAASVEAAINNAGTVASPFRYWLFDGLIPAAACREITALPIAPVQFSDTYGKRDSHNDSRRFFSPVMQESHPIMRAMAEAFQSPAVVRAFEKLCGISLKGSYLRIEYCQDSSGFWLEPHMDIKEKFITLQMYLNEGEGARKLGTDLYDSNKKYFCTADGRLGKSMLFLPKEPESWHGFEKRPIAGIRRSLIINYVTDDWRSRHELSFPDRKIS